MTLRLDTPRARTTRRAHPRPRRETTEIVQGLRRIVRALHVYAQDVRHEYGLTGPQLWALKTLHREGTMSASQLATALAVQRSSAALLAERLEERGLVKRVRHRGDDRSVELELTRRGAAIVTVAPDAAQGRLLRALEAMPESELREFRDTIGELVRAIEVTDLPARFFFADS